MPEKNGGGDTPKTPDTDASIQPPPQPPGNQNPPAPPPDDNSHNNQARITELEQETRGGERWLIGIGIATMVINTGIALIYLGQLLQMRKATRAAALGAYSACLSAQVSRSVLTQTQVAESDAHASAVATVYQAMSATESERAEMQLSLGKPEIRVGQYFRIPFSTNNAGKTAAIGLTMDLRLVFLSRNEDPDFRYPPHMGVHGYNGRAEPGPGFAVDTRFVTAIGPDKKLSVPSENDRDEYLASKEDLILYGRMTYRDIFGAPHWRNFCQPFQTFPEGLIADTGHKKCALYNQSDVGNSLVKPTPTPQATPSYPEIVCKNPE